MLLHAVIVPPPDVLAAVSHVVLSIESVAAPPPPPPPPSRFLRRRVVAPAVPAPITADRELDLIPPVAMNLPIAGFGNVTAGDAEKLADTMKDAAAEWACPTVWLGGGGALEFPGDRSVWAKLDGDVEALLAVARGVVQSVASRGFFVDRRKFRPWLAVANDHRVHHGPLPRACGGGPRRVSGRALDDRMGVGHEAVVRSSRRGVAGGAPNPTRDALTSRDQSPGCSPSSSAVEAPSSSLTTANARPAE